MQGTGTGSGSGYRKRRASLIPHPSSLIPHPSSLIPHPSSLVHLPSSFFLRPSSLVTLPSSPIGQSLSYLPPELFHPLSVLGGRENGRILDTELCFNGLPGL